MSGAVVAGLEDLDGVDLAHRAPFVEADGVDDELSVDRVAEIGAQLVDRLREIAAVLDELLEVNHRVPPPRAAGGVRLHHRLEVAVADLQDVLEGSDGAQGGESSGCGAAAKPQAQRRRRAGDAAGGQLLADAREGETAPIEGTPEPRGEGVLDFNDAPPGSFALYR